MAKNAILMSIRPQYAEKIFAKTKTVELRRIKPIHLKSGSLIFVYVSSPVKALVGAFNVSSVIEKPVPALWTQVSAFAGVSRDEFYNYFDGAKSGVAIFIKDVWLLPKPIQLAELRTANGFHPPQSFRYTNIRSITNLSNL